LRTSEAARRGSRGTVQFAGLRWLPRWTGGSAAADRSHIGDWESIRRELISRGTVAQGRRLQLAQVLQPGSGRPGHDDDIALLALLASSFRHRKRVIGGRRGPGIPGCGRASGASAVPLLSIDPYQTIPGLLLVAHRLSRRAAQEGHTPTYQRIFLATAAGLATWTISYPMPGIPQAMWASSCALIAASQVAFQKRPWRPARCGRSHWPPWC